MITLKNDIPEVHYNLAYVYKSLGKDKVAQSYLDNYNKLLQAGLQTIDKKFFFVEVISLSSLIL